MLCRARYWLLPCYSFWISWFANVSLLKRRTFFIEQGICHMFDTSIWHNLTANRLLIMVLIRLTTLQGRRSTQQNLTAEIIGKIFAETWYFTWHQLSRWCAYARRGSAMSSNREEGAPKRKLLNKSRVGGQALSYHSNSKPRVSISIRKEDMRNTGRPQKVRYRLWSWIRASGRDYSPGAYRGHFGVSGTHVYI